MVRWGDWVGRAGALLLLALGGAWRHCARACASRGAGPPDGRPPLDVAVLTPGLARGWRSRCALVAARGPAVAGAGHAAAHRPAGAVAGAAAAVRAGAVRGAAARGVARCSVWFAARVRIEGARAGAGPAPPAHRDPAGVDRCAAAVAPAAARARRRPAAGIADAAGRMRIARRNRCACAMPAGAARADARGATGARPTAARALAEARGTRATRAATLDQPLLKFGAVPAAAGAGGVPPAPGHRLRRYVRRVLHLRAWRPGSPGC